MEINYLWKSVPLLNLYFMLIIQEIGKLQRDLLFWKTQFLFEDRLFYCLRRKSMWRRDQYFMRMARYFEGGQSASFEDLLRRTILVKCTF